MEKAEAELEQRRGVGNLFGSHIGGLHLSQLEHNEWSVFDEQAKSLKGGINVWDKIHEKVDMMGVLRLHVCRGGEG